TSVVFLFLFFCMLYLYVFVFFCFFFFFFFSSRRRHTRFDCDWSSDVCSSDLSRRPDRCAGGTGGHIYPGVAIAREFKRRDEATRSEERRVGKECRCRWGAEQ